MTKSKFTIKKFHKTWGIWDNTLDEWYAVGYVFKDQAQAALDRIINLRIMIGD